MRASSIIPGNTTETLIFWLAEDGRVEFIKGEWLEATDPPVDRIELGDFIWDWVIGWTADSFADWWRQARPDRPRETVIEFGKMQRRTVRVRLRSRQIKRMGQAFVRCELFSTNQSSSASSLARWGLRYSRGGAAQWDVRSGELIVTDALYRLLYGERPVDAPAPRTFVALMQRVCDNQALRQLVDTVRDAQQQQSAQSCTVAATLPGRGDCHLQIYCEPHMASEPSLVLRLWVQELLRVGSSPDQLIDTLDALASMVLHLDVEGAVVGSNAVAREQLQLASPAVDELTYARLEIDGDAATWNVLRERAREDGASPRSEALWRLPNGNLLTVRRQVLATSDPAVPFVLVGDDRTLELELEKELALTRIRPEDADPKGDGHRADAELGVQIIYQSEPYKALMRQLRMVGPTDSTVLILGETGTGKELLARALHEFSSRRGQALIKINCAVLPETLAESELFGHEKGSFTGAYSRQIGKFEQAHGGTIFLDEVGELSPNVQAKLLRVLQEGEIERIGGEGVQRVDVRVVAATNRDLRAMVDEGRFRSDLYFRLNVFPVYNPPLRERPADVVPLANHLLRKHSQLLNRHVERIGERALQRLQNYSFPGNVRELENIIERGVIMASGPVLQLDDWQLEAPLKTANERLPTFEEGQRLLIERALRRTRGRVSGAGGAAELLALNPQTLYSKIRKLGIDRDDF